MNRRDFSKITLTAATFLSAAPVWANSFVKEKAALRIGGPVPKKYADADGWIEELKKKNYKATYCPLKIGAESYEIQSYKRAAEKADIIISEVGAWSNPIDPDDKKSKEAIQKCITSLQLADEIGANCCVNISGSRNPEKWDGPHKDNLTSGTFDLIVETTRKIIDAVKPVNTFYALETMPWSYPDSVESYEKLLKAINRKQFGVHFDPVNLITSPQAYYKNGEMIADAFKKLGKYIKNCHAKDILIGNELTLHLHEVRPGLGNLDYVTFLKELSKLKNVPLMLEHLKTEEEYDSAAKHIREIGSQHNILM